MIVLLFSSSYKWKANKLQVKSDATTFQLQEERSLKDHTSDFIDLACLNHYPDYSLWLFYYTSLNEQSKARLPVNLSGCW